MIAVDARISALSACLVNPRDLFRHREEVGGAGPKSPLPLQARDLRFDAVERRWTPLSDNLRVNTDRPSP
jgi:hypothetical protein